MAQTSKDDYVLQRYEKSSVVETLTEQEIAGGGEKEMEEKGDGREEEGVRHGPYHTQLVPVKRVELDDVDRPHTTPSGDKSSSKDYDDDDDQRARLIRRPWWMGGRSLFAFRVNKKKYVFKNGRWRSEKITFKKKRNLSGSIRRSRESKSTRDLTRATAVLRGATGWSKKREDSRDPPKMGMGLQKQAGNATIDVHIAKDKRRKVLVV
eukprot:GHVU01152490.1.p1 GENE.GHVU01152490.1~~GHVU01152490.1.p1  ORF type:complete len:208 (-),score=29.69 GHVU01152490.1:58-681(-)